MAVDVAKPGRFARLAGDKRSFVVLQVEADRALVAPVDERWWEGLEDQERTGRPGQFLKVKGHDGLFVTLHTAEVERKVTGFGVEGVVVAPVCVAEAAWRKIKDLKPHQGAWKWSQRLLERC